LYLRPEIEKYAKANVDCYGDSYTTPMAVAEARAVSPCRRSILTRKLLESMGEIESDEDSHDLTVEDLLDEKDEKTLGRLFARCKVYLDSSTLEDGSDLSARANKYVPVFLTYTSPQRSYYSNVPTIRVSAVCAILRRCAYYSCDCGRAKDIDYSVYALQVRARR
jgi:hypothetical protein